LTAAVGETHRTSVPKRGEIQFSFEWQIARKKMGKQVEQIRDSALLERVLLQVCICMLILGRGVEKSREWMCAKRTNRSGGILMPL